MDVDASKIPDPELRDFVQAEESDEPRSVIVELEMGPPDLAPRQTVPRPRVPGRDRVAPFDLAKTEGHDGAMNQLERELLALGLAQDLVRLNAAQAFVVSASPAQVRIISRLPLVGVIRPNRTHRVPSAL